MESMEGFEDFCRVGIERIHEREDESETTRREEKDDRRLAPYGQIHSP